jgi:CRP-like cAMP-binding protein
MTEKLSQYIRDKFTTDDNSLQQILSVFKQITTTKNEILLSKGDRSKYCYFVLEGVLRMLLDHLILTSESYYSFADEGLI